MRWDRYGLRLTVGNRRDKPARKDSMTEAENKAQFVAALTAEALKHIAKRDRTPDAEAKVKIWSEGFATEYNDTFSKLLALSGSNPDNAKLRSFVLIYIAAKESLIKGGCLSSFEHGYIAWLKKSPAYENITQAAREVHSPASPQFEVISMAQKSETLKVLLAALFTGYYMLDNSAEVLS